MLKKLADAAANVAIFAVSSAVTVGVIAVGIYLVQKHLTCVDFINKLCVIH